MVDEQREKDEKQALQDMRLVDRNAKAAMAALDRQNKKLAEYEQKINLLTRQFVQMHEEFLQIKQQQMSELIEKMGHGPTA